MLNSGVLLISILLLVLVLTLLIARSRKKSVKIILLGFNFVILLALIFWSLNLIIPNLASAADIVNGESSSSGLGYMAAGLAVGLASIGAGIGVGIAGAAAIGAISEKPEILGRTLIFIGLAEGVAIYGLIISIMILGRL